VEGKRRAAVESMKVRARVVAGACLHHMGLHEKLLLVRSPIERFWKRRLRSYLTSYYDTVESAEAALYVPELDLVFVCDLKDHMLEPYLQGRAGVYELREIDHFRRRCRAGDQLLDLGANHGFWGFSVARAAGRGTRLVLVEANPVIARRLRRTARFNPAIEATVVECAIGDGIRREATFYLPRAGLSGLGSLVLHDTARTNKYLTEEHTITVPSRALDDLVAAGVVTGMDLVKIDLEQAEDVMVSGAQESFRRFRPRLVMCETSNDSATYRFFRHLGYEDYLLDEAGRPAPVPRDPFWGNIFFARTESRRSESR